MNYRFRVSERNKELPAQLPRPVRRYRLKGRTTLRLSREEAERIRLSQLFELSELPKGEDIAHRRRKKLKKQKKPRPTRKKKHLVRKAFGAFATFLGNAWQAIKEKAEHSSAASIPIFAGALCAALLVSALSSGAVLLHLFGGYHAPYDAWTVPNFVGQEPQNVLANESEAIEDLPWNLIVQYADHAEVAAGRVISQTPTAGVTRRIYRNGGFCNITLTVSRGRPTYNLEDLAGKSERDARLILKNQGLRVDVQKIDAKDTPKGSVLGTRPKAGATLHEGDRVILQVSRGQTLQLLSVPNLSGLTEERASTLLRAKGLRVGTVSYAVSERPAGTVIAQTPNSHASLHAGDTVSYTVSIGQSISLRSVPNLCGLSYADAVARLREYGLVVGSLSSIESAAPRGTVIRQSPEAGTPITSSTVSVDLYLSS